MQQPTRRATLMLGLGALALGAGHAAPAQTDRWQALRRYVGEWSGTASGRAGDGTVTRSYRFIMNERYLHEINVSRYLPQERNKSGEVHEHWSLFSHDKARNTIVLRQFHVEGFVINYRMAPPDKPFSVYSRNQLRRAAR